MGQMRDAALVDAKEQCPSNIVTNHYFLLSYSAAQSLIYKALLIGIAKIDTASLATSSAFYVIYQYSIEQPQTPRLGLLSRERAESRHRIQAGLSNLFDADDGKSCQTRTKKREQALVLHIFS